MATLNQWSRDALVRGVLGDVPTIDYIEEINKLVAPWWIQQMPLRVHALYTDKDLRHHLHKEFVSILIQRGEDPDDVVYVNVGALYGLVDASWLVRELPEGIKKKLVELSEADRIQKSSLDALGRELRTSFKKFRTTTALIKAFPEFEKYVPKDEPETEHPVPAVNDLMAELVKAGWPKKESA